MLTEEVLSAAVALTERADMAHVVVVPIEGTPLDALVRATRSPANVMNAFGSDYASDIKHITYMANAKDVLIDRCEHDEVMEDILAPAIAAVRQHLFIARNLVQPAIKAMVQAVQAHLDTLPVSKLLGLEVKTFCSPQPLQNPAFASMVRRFEENAFRHQPLNLNLPDQSYEEICELMRTGSAELDSDIAAWASTMGSGCLIELWQAIFQLKSKNDRYNTLKAALDDPEWGVDNALAVFLLTRKLAEKPIAGITMALPRFEDAMVAWRNQSAGKLVAALDKQAIQMRQGQLVKSQMGKTIWVNEAVYRPWIEAGGSNDILFGNMLSASPKVMAADIDAQAEASRAAWQRHAGLSTATWQAERFMALKEILRAEFKREISEVTEDPTGPDVCEGNRAYVMKLFEEEVRKITPEDTKDLYSLCMKLICRARFYQTDAEQILSAIERLHQEHPTLPTRELGTMATIEYVADWVASQMKAMGA